VKYDKVMSRRKYLPTTLFHYNHVYIITILQNINALLKMNEIQDIASGRGYSLPIKEKEKRFFWMGNMAKDIGFKIISTCRCKNQIARVPRIMTHDCHFHDKWF